MIKRKVGIIGCGNMGEAILARLKAKAEVSVGEADSSRRDYLKKKYKITASADNKKIVKDSGIIILAIKPKDFEKVLREDVAPSLRKGGLVVSIAAGITTKYIEKILGKVSVVRAMPNLPATIGEGISGISAGAFAGTKDLEKARRILSLIGEVVIVKEEMLDAVTAISGSGPAYFYYLAEALMEAAEELGIDKKSAYRLVAKTALGSFKLLYELEEHPSILRSKVASKGGTTEAALQLFEEKELKDIIRKAVRRAFERSKELSKG